MIKYLSYWQSVDPLTLLEVGFLWAGYEPPPDEELLERERPATQMQSMVAIPSNLFRPKPLPSRVRRSFETIITAMRCGLLPEPQPSWINLDVLSPKNINNFALINITRTNLITLSKQLLKTGDIYTVPAFLVVLDAPEPCKNDPVVDQGAIADTGPVDTEKDKSRAFVLSQKNVINNIYDLITCHSLFKKTLLFITPEGGFNPPDRALGPSFKTTGFQPYSFQLTVQSASFYATSFQMVVVYFVHGTAHQRASHI